MTWKIYKRKARWRRRFATRGEEYDGSRWEIHKSYKKEKHARQALEKLLDKDGPDWADWKMHQWKLVGPRHGQDEKSPDGDRRADR